MVNAHMIVNSLTQRVPHQGLSVTCQPTVNTSFTITPHRPSPQGKYRVHGRRPDQAVTARHFSRLPIVCFDFVDVSSHSSTPSRIESNVRKTSTILIPRHPDAFCRYPLSTLPAANILGQNHHTRDTCIKHRSHGCFGCGDSATCVSCLLHNFAECL